MSQLRQIRDQRSEVRNSLWLMITILLIATAFRFLAIDSAPPGWRDDELIEFDMDRRIADGWRPLFINEAEGHEPVYHYLHAGTILLFGDNIIGYKWLPMAFGLLTIALTYALARRIFGARAALLAAALMAVSFWPIMYSRFGVRHIGTLPLMLGAFYWLYPSPQPSPHKGRGVPLREWVRDERRVIFAGVLLAAALMTYFAGRALPIILSGFLMYLALFQRSIFKRVWWRYLVAFVIAVLIALPMFIEIARTPGAEKRTEVVGGPLIELSHGNVKPAIDTTLGTLGMFTFAGDPESLYNVSGRPVFDWITGLFFYIGVVLCIIRLKRLESGFALTWLLIGIAPAFVSLPAASFSHTLAAQPIVYILTSFGVIEVASLIGKLIERGRDRATERISPLLSLSISLSVGLVAIGGWLTIRDYFGTWAHDEFVRFQYHAPTRDIAHWLDQNPDVTNVAIGTHPNELVLDPLALRLDLAREDVKARWFNPDQAFVIPQRGPVIISSMQPIGAEIRRTLARAVELQQLGLEQVRLPVFDVYQVIGTNLDLWPKAVFSDTLALILSGPHKVVIRAGDRFPWGTVWHVIKPAPNFPLKSFVHVLDLQNQYITGEDRFDVDVPSLLTGDVVYQLHQVVLPADLPVGRYFVEIGWYEPGSGKRLQLPDGSDHVLTGPIAEVLAP